MLPAACRCGKHPDAAAVGQVCVAVTDGHAIESDVVLEFSAFGGLIVLRVSASIHH